MKIIMLSGKQGSGKSTISEALKEYWFNKHHKNMVSQLKFAGVLYEMHDAVLNVLHKYMAPRQIVKDGPLLQLLGTEWGRKTIGENIWVELMNAQIYKKIIDCPIGLHSHGLLIIDDCRFENEFDALPDALRVRLRAEEGARKARCSMWRENTNHPSETGLDDYAVQGQFDLYLSTDTETVGHCVTMIAAQLDKNNWVEKRK